MQRYRIIHSRAPISYPSIIGDHCEIGPNAYIDPYTSIGDNSTITNTEIENSIIMEGAHIDCGGRIKDSLTGQNDISLNHEHSLPRGHKLILGDQSTVNL